MGLGFWDSCINQEFCLSPEVHKAGVYCNIKYNQALMCTVKRKYKTNRVRRTLCASEKTYSLSMLSLLPKSGVKKRKPNTMQCP